ncbi:conserved hypothetical protein [Ricinus communis]|uniref:Reverse transcriptase domain-containing protein n=1 Tax=Ricinus communis TaxID=3988 RepID=B9T7A9_RICCO|nr:conserved hypothetical protein [Ricinus communis]
MYAGNGVKVPSQFLYADEILIFGKASISNIRLLAHIFAIYGSLSGQMVNWEKSQIFLGAPICQWRSSQLPQVSDMKLGSLPFTYLGIHLFKGAPKSIHLQSIADKIYSKMEGWKGSLLSMIWKHFIPPSRSVLFWKIFMMIFFGIRVSLSLPAAVYVYKIMKR